MFNRTLRNDVTVDEIVNYLSRHLLIVDLNILTAIGSYLIFIENAPFCDYLDSERSHTSFVDSIGSKIGINLSYHDVTKTLGHQVFLHFLFNVQVMPNLSRDDKLKYARERVGFYNCSEINFYLSRHLALDYFTYVELIVCIVHRAVLSDGPNVSPESVRSKLLGIQTCPCCASLDLGDFIRYLIRKIPSTPSNS